MFQPYSQIHPITMFTDKAFSDEPEIEELILRKGAMDLKFLCLALEIKWVNAFDAKKKIDFLGISLKDDWAFPKTSSTLAAFIGIKMDCQKFTNWKLDFLKSQDVLQDKLCQAMFDYYDQNADGNIDRKELTMLLYDIGDNNDDEKYWKDENFINITSKRLGKLNRERFKAFYDSYINSDLSGYHQEICFELETKSDRFTKEKLEKLMIQIKEEPSKNLWRDIQVTHLKLAELYETEVFIRKPLLEFFGVGSVEDDEQNFELLNESVQGGKGLTFAFVNLAYDYYDSEKLGYLPVEQIKKFLEDSGCENAEEKATQIITKYYDEYLGDVLVFYTFSKVFNEIFIKRGIKMNLGDVSDVDSDEDGENLFNGVGGDDSD